MNFVLESTEHVLSQDEWLRNYKKDVFDDPGDKFLFRSFGRRPKMFW
jgi:hypothetical protein